MAAWMPSKSTEIFVRQKVQKFFLSCNPVSLNQGQGHLDYFQTMEFSSIYHQSTFELHWFLNVQMYANIDIFLRNE